MDLKEATAIDGRGYSSHFGKEATAAEATMTSTMIVIVAVSATFLVISVLSAGLLVVYCRRVKVCTIYQKMYCIAVFEILAGFII